MKITLDGVEKVANGIAMFCVFASGLFHLAAGLISDDMSQATVGLLLLIFNEIRQLNGKTNDGKG